MRSKATRTLAAGAVLLALLLAACESPDVSYRTSPSARSMLGGITGGGVLYSIPELPPEPVDAPDGWSFELGNARYEELQNGTPSIQVTNQITTKPGSSMEIWLSNADETIAKWSGGNVQNYSGVVCWQMELKEDDVILPLKVGEKYSLTIAFRDLEDGGVVAAQRVEIRNDVPKLEGTPAQTGSDVFKHLLACPRGS